MIWPLSCALGKSDTYISIQENCFISQRLLLNLLPVAKPSVVSDEHSHI